MSARAKWILAVVVAVLAVPVVSFMPRSTARIVSVAERLQPDAHLVLTAEHVEPPRFICLGDNPCPSAFYTWASDRPITTADLTRWLAEAGYPTAIEGDCEGPGRQGIAITTCHTAGSVGGFEVRVAVTVDQDEATTQLRLSLR